MVDENRQQRAMALALINDPSHWWDRAEEARRIAEDIGNAEAKRMMLGIADGYDRMAHHAENRLLTRQSWTNAPFTVSQRRRDNKRLHRAMAETVVNQYVKA